MSVRIQAPSETSIWMNSRSVFDLYRQRARNEEVEMTCAAQAATLLDGISSRGQVVLDVGCGSGWFVHSLRSRGLDLEYWGVDATESFVSLAHSELAAYGIPNERVLHGRIEDLGGSVDHVVCMNVLTNIDNWHRPLDRMCEIAGDSIILRESFGETSQYSLVIDRFLDGALPLKVHVNTYCREEFVQFLMQRGFACEFVVDERTEGRPEQVIGYPHHWEFLIARRQQGGRE